MQYQLKKSNQLNQFGLNLFLINDKLLVCTLCFIIRVTFFKKSSLQKRLHEILISDPHFKGMTKQKLLSDGFLYH